MKKDILNIESSDLEEIEAIAIDLEERGCRDKALSLYKIGRYAGSHTCTTRMADMLSEPPKFEDVEIAEVLYKEACVAGHAPACRNLAILYGQLGRSELSQKYMGYAKSRGDVWQVED